MRSSTTDHCEPGRYWEQRFSEHLDITTVGHAGLGRVYNSWLYKARFRTLQHTLRTLGIVVRGKSIAELGVGSGIWIPFWQAREPVSLTGVDITSASIEALQAKYPQYDFIQGDLSVPLPLAQVRCFDVVTAFDVLFHLVDDSGFAQAIANIGKLVAPGGCALISDSFCSRPWGPFVHEYHRSYSHYAHELRSAGMTPVHIRPIFFMMTTTLCSEYGRLSQATRLILTTISKLASRRILETFNHAPGLSLYIIDGLLARIYENGPSLKLMVARKD